MNYGNNGGYYPPQNQRNDQLSGGQQIPGGTPGYSYQGQQNQIPPYGQPVQQIPAQPTQYPYAGQPLPQQQGYPQYGYVQQGYPAMYPEQVVQYQPKPVDVQRKRASVDFNRTMLILIGMTVLSVIGQFAVMAIYGATNISLTTSTGYSYYWLMLILSPFTTMLSGVIYLIATKPSLSAYMRFENEKGKFNTFLAVLAAVGVCMLANYPANIVNGILEPFGLVPEAYEPEVFEWGSQILYGISVVILAPLFEEFVFRGIIFSRLEKHGAGFAVVGSALIFGLAHTYLGNVVFAFVVGLALGFLYYKTRNLWACIAVHFINNFMSVGMSFMYEFLPEQWMDQFSTILMLSLMAIGLIALLLLATVRRKSFFGKSHMPVYEMQVQAAGKLGFNRSAAAIVRSPMLWVQVGYIILNIAMLPLIQ